MSDEEEKAREAFRAGFNYASDLAGACCGCNLAPLEEEEFQRWRERRDEE
ncbi:hypothetical protein [Micromonospora sp. NPDC049240]